MRSQLDYVKDIETKKRKLQDDLDALTEELAKIKAQGLIDFSFKKTFFLLANVACNLNQ